MENVYLCTAKTVECTTVFSVRVIKNIIELIRRGYSVDVGVVELTRVNEQGKKQQSLPVLTSSSIRGARKSISSRH